MCRSDDFPPYPEPGDPCAKCGHPCASHEVTDDEPGPCWDQPCACDAFEAAGEPTAARLERLAHPRGPSLDQGHAAAWRQHQELHR